MDKKIYFIFLIIFLILLILLMTISADSHLKKEYIFLEISYKNGNFSLINKTLEKGYYPKAIIDDYEYKVNIVSDRGEIIYSTAFDPILLFTDSFSNEIIEGGAIRLNETEFYVILPNLKTAEKAEILKIIGQNGESVKVFEVEIYDVGAESCRIK